MWKFKIKYVFFEIIKIISKTSFEESWIDYKLQIYLNIDSLFVYR